MKAAVIGALAGTTLAVAALGGLSPLGRAFAQRPSAEVAGDASELIVLSSPAGDSRQQVTVIDPRSRVMSVYHISGATGEIALKSVRDFHWDLRMTELNGVSPLPHEVRSLVEPNYNR